MTESAPSTGPTAVPTPNPLSNPITLMEAAERMRAFANGGVQAPSADDARLLAEAVDRALLDLERCGVGATSHLPTDDRTVFDSSTAADAVESLRAHLNTVRARLARCVTQLGGSSSNDLIHMAESLEGLVAAAVADREDLASGVLTIEIADADLMRRQIVDRLVVYIHHTRARLSRRTAGRGCAEIDLDRFFDDLLSGLLPAARSVDCFAPSTDELAALKSLVWGHYKLDVTSDVGGERRSVDRPLLDQFWRMFERVLTAYGEERT